VSAGGVFRLVDPGRINELQHIAVEQSPHGIPILFGYDTIHGYRTTFPDPAGHGQLVRPGRRCRRPPDRRYDNAVTFVVEPGRIDLYAGNSSRATMRHPFTVSG